MNLYEMDVRSYDPAIGRFTGIDPVTHHSQSTYAAFDNNPVYWSDPSGANSASRIQGRTAIPGITATVEGVIKRSDADLENSRQNGFDEGPTWDIYSVFDGVFSVDVAVAATLFFDGKEVGNLSEKDKRKIFREDTNKTIGVLLWEFATGQGEEIRDFYSSKHPFAKDFFSGQVLNELFKEFHDKLKDLNYDFSALNDTKIIPLTYEFGPNDTSSFKESYVKHKNSNLAQFFIGGTSVEGSIKDGNLIFQVSNFTSRSSLLFHLFEVKDYPRKNNRNRPLSTIQQNINVKFKIDK